MRTNDINRVDWFAAFMKEKLKEKEPEKSGWDYVHLLWLHAKLTEELGELGEALIGYHDIYGEQVHRDSSSTVRSMRAREIIFHAADVANMAFMIADNMRLIIEDDIHFGLAAPDLDNYDEYAERWRDD